MKPLDAARHVEAEIGPGYVGEPKIARRPVPQIIDELFDPLSPDHLLGRRSEIGIRARNKPIIPNLVRIGLVFGRPIEMGVGYPRASRPPSLGAGNHRPAESALEGSRPYSPLGKQLSVGFTGCRPIRALGQFTER